MSNVIYYRWKNKVTTITDKNHRQNFKMTRNYLNPSKNRGTTINICHTLIGEKHISCLSVKISVYRSTHDNLSEVCDLKGVQLLYHVTLKVCLRK